MACESCRKEHQEQYDRSGASHLQGGCVWQCVHELKEMGVPEIPHTISLTRAELQDEWDKSCRLVERLTQAVKTLAEERDEAREKIIIANIIIGATNDDEYKVAAIRKVLSSVEK